MAYNLLQSLSTLDYKSKAVRETIVRVHFTVIDERYECLRNNLDNDIPCTGQLLSDQ